MNEDLANIQYSPIRDYKYKEWFEEIKYNGKTLSDAERKQCVAMINESIDQLSECLPHIHDALESIRDKHDNYHETYRTIISAMQFLTIMMIDCQVAGKYFLLADRDYDKRFMRGKLMVILNEGFKRLYGFEEKTNKKSQWDRLLSLLGRFPEVINLQYQELTFLLEQHARSSSWWKQERDFETHMDTEKIYISRQEEIIESKVMMDSMKLFSALYSVNQFLTNMHACVRNSLIDKYRRGELKDE